MKGMTSGSFVFTAPCAVDSSSIPTGICTLDHNSYKSTESLENRSIERFLRKFLIQPHRIPGVSGRGMPWPAQQTFCSPEAVWTAGRPRTSLTQLWGWNDEV